MLLSPSRPQDFWRRIASPRLDRTFLILTVSTSESTYLQLSTHHHQQSTAPDSHMARDERAANCDNSCAAERKRRLFTFVGEHARLLRAALMPVAACFHRPCNLSSVSAPYLEADPINSAFRNLSSSSDGCPLDVCSGTWHTNFGKGVY